MVKTLFKIIGISLLLGYLLSAGIIYGFWREQPRYRGIMVDISYPNDEAHFINDSEILRLVKNYKPGFQYEGKLYNEVNTLELTQYIEQHNRLIQRAACYHTPDSLLRIDITQRNPILRIKSLNGVKDQYGDMQRDFFVDHEGQLMTVPRGSSIRLPLVTGHVHERDILPLVEFASFLHDDDFWGDNIVQINMFNNGDVELVPRVGDHTIMLGPLDGFEHKLDNVRQFYDKVLPRKGWNAYRVINVKFDGQVIGEK